MTSLTEPAPERPSHPKYGLALGGRPKLRGGVLFYPFRTGISRYTYATADGRVEVYENANHTKTRHLGTTFWAVVDGRPLGRRFLKFETAARAGLAALSQPAMGNTTQ